MKLYATTTSERATKGQGGNRFLCIDITTEANMKIATININKSPTLGKGIYILNANIMGSKIEKIIYHLEIKKGEKLKTVKDWQDELPRRGTEDMPQ